MNSKNKAKFNSIAIFANCMFSTSTSVFLVLLKLPLPLVSGHR